MNTKEFVIVRTYSAGVHAGYLVSREGKEVTLSECVRVWSWLGANTLHEISLHGVAEGSYISKPIPRILLLEAIEVIPSSENVRENLIQRAEKWGE